jgi:hypothetical protein
MRVVWGSITPTTALRTRAYTLDAVAEELLFTVGPLVVAVVVAVASPAAALVAAAAASVVGTVTVTSSSVSRALIGSSVTAATVSGRPLRQRGFRPVLVALVGAGIILGVIEIAASAFAVDAGSRELAGPLMAGFAGGSAIGGLAYGSRDWRSGPSRRLLALGLGMVIATGTLVVAPTLLTIGALLVVVGLFLAPSLVTGYLLADLYTVAEGPYRGVQLDQHVGQRRRGARGHDRRSRHRPLRRRRGHCNRGRGSLVVPSATGLSAPAASPRRGNSTPDRGDLITPPLGDGLPPLRR